MQNQYLDFGSTQKRLFKNYSMKKIIFLLSLSIFIINLNAQGLILSNPSDCRLDLEITDNQCPDGTNFFNPNRFAIEVNNTPGNQLGVDVYLKEVRIIISHNWSGDIETRLISPSGKEVLLTDDIGGSNNNYGNPNRSGCSEAMVLSTDACITITDQDQTNPPFIDQPYRPIESLLNFNDGSNPNGLWILSVCDDVEEDVGSLEFIELVFEPLSCLSISDVFIQNQDSTSVLLDWVPNGDCGTVNTLIEYGPPGFTPGSTDTAGIGGTIITASCPPFLLTGLPPETSIDLYIRKQCGPNTFSANTCGISLETGCVPPGPTTTEDFDEEILCTSRCERSQFFRSAVTFAGEEAADS